MNNKNNHIIFGYGDDIDEKGNDNYLDTYMNISRNFNNKMKQREMVLPKDLCVAYHDLSKCSCNMD